VADVIAAKDQTISELSADLAYLRHHLDQVTEQLDQSRRELAVLHQSTAIRLAALTPATGDQRPDAPTRAPDALRRDEDPSEGVQTLVVDGRVAEAAGRLDVWVGEPSASGMLRR